MNKPIDNLIYRVQNRKITDFKTYNYTPEGPLHFTKIQDGPDKGFYVARSKNGTTVLKFGKPVLYTQVTFKQTPHPSYKNFVTFSEGFYYIPKTEIPIRKLAYALENNAMPNSGNIETYIKSFNRISMPLDFCPNIDPCVYDWCTYCRDLQKPKVLPKTKQTHYIYLFLTLGFISMIATLAFTL